MAEREVIALLDESKGRIERMALEPESIRDTLGWLAGPFLRALNWQPKLTTRAITALLDAMREHAEDDAEPGRSSLRAAIAELEDNLDAVERACVVRGAAPMALVSWLWRVHRLLTLVHMELERSPARWTTGLDRSVLFMPILVPPKPGQEPTVALGTIDALLDAARAENDILARRRRLLEAARRLLVEAAAALALPKDAVAPRYAYLAREVAAVDRFEAAGVVASTSLTHQLRRALGRADRERLVALLGAMDHTAAGSGDGALATLTTDALQRLVPDHARTAALHRSSIARSAHQLLGAPVVDAIGGALRNAPDRLEARLRSASPLEQRDLQNARPFLDAEAAQEALAAALSVDGCFDVGGVASPIRVDEEILRLRTVAHPTEQLVLTSLTSLDELGNAVIEDPRTLLYGLASGRLLTRRYVAPVVERTRRTVLSTEVRVYLLDGSTSMLGPRARMRDAILVAELATLIERLKKPDRFINPVLYYRYFTKRRWPIHRVATQPEAIDAIAEVLGDIRTGGTNIEAALLDSFAQIRDARGTDEAIAQAQIVLVTDGNAQVDEARVQEAREAVGEIPVGLSVIALGEENPALRSIAAAQRARGERAFYHFLDDAELEAIVAGRPDDRLVVHVPEIDETRGAPIDEGLRELVDEITALERKRDAESLEELGRFRTALDEVGLDYDLNLDEAERARLEAAHQDRVSLERRFDRWFPRLPEPPAESEPPPRPLRGSREAEQLAIADELLGAVAEVTRSLASGSPLRRQADAIEIVERLLIEAGIPPWRWAQILEREGAHLRGALLEVRAAAMRDG